MTRRAPLAVLLAAPALFLACAGGDDESLSTIPPTVPNVGNLPGPLAVYATATSEAAPATTDGDAPGTSEPDDGVDEDEPTLETIGELAEGPRVLLLGDSITQSIGEEFSGGVCRELVPAGWQVATDAQTGRFIDHGLDILEERIDDAEWDAAVLNFGSNYRGDAEDYGLTLRRMLNRLLPRPVLLITVSEPEENRAEVNYVLREAARRYENVRILEWSEATRLDESLTGGDGLHLSTAGQEALATMLAEAMGEAPGGGEGACLDIDDLTAGGSSGTPDSDESSDTSDGGTADTDTTDTDTSGTDETSDTGDA